jgi:site-specific DNA recombinase
VAELRTQPALVLYRAIEDGIVELDNNLKERIRTLKTERDIAQTSLDRIAIQARASATINPDLLNAFSSLMCEKLDRGDTQARKSYLRSVISHVEVDDDKIRIIGDKAVLAGVVAGRQAQTTNVSGFVLNWRARRDSNS